MIENVPKLVVICNNLVYNQILSQNVANWQIWGVMWPFLSKFWRKSQKSAISIFTENFYNFWSFWPILPKFGMYHLCGCTQNPNAGNFDFRIFAFFMGVRTWKMAIYSFFDSAKAS